MSYRRHRQAAAGVEEISAALSGRPALPLRAIPGTVRRRHPRCRCPAVRSPGPGPCREEVSGLDYRLAVDLGTCHTVAVVRRGDEAPRPVLFDGSPLLPSGVYAGPGGTLHVGRDAERM